MKTSFLKVSILAIFALMFVVRTNAQVSATAAANELGQITDAVYTSPATLNLTGDTPAGDFVESSTEGTDYVVIGGA